MKSFFLKFTIGIFSVFLAGFIWIGFALVLFNSGVSFLGKLAVYISHLSFIGWSIFGLLSIILYSAITKFISKKWGLLNEKSDAISTKPQ